MAERALVAQELGLPRPARVLGYRGLARIDLGDRRGLEDLREAVELATEAGQGGEVTNLHNNLGMALWMFEGPSVAPEVFREGIANAKARGGSVAIDALTTGTLDPLFETGELDSVLEVATEMAPRLETRKDVYQLIPVRAIQTRIFALRGQDASPRRSTGSRRRPGRREASRMSSTGWAPRTRARRARAGRGRDRTAHELEAIPAPATRSTRSPCSPRWCARP